MSVWADQLAVIAADTSPIANLLRGKITPLGAAFDAAGSPSFTETADHVAWRTAAAAAAAQRARITTAAQAGDDAAKQLLTDLNSARGTLLGAEPSFYPPPASVARGGARTAVKIQQDLAAALAELAVYIATR